MTIIKNVPFDLANTRVDKAVSELFPDFSRTQIKKWILDGRILVNGELSKPKDNVYENDEIEINPDEEKKVSWKAQKINFDIHYESDNFICIIEAKMNLDCDDFNLRQLYIPFMSTIVKLKSMNISKTVIPFFIYQDKNRIIHIHELKWKNYSCLVFALMHQ